ncbi:hypothetical protein PF005_g7590 [Phytophthora fragariae]|uniref:Uncharacterized protein n=1 Tax=Phytophthora fragariae TaxID=53985 RepID=A0A6A3UC83_9STRA|nr:hypothetical protein PF009_g8329 [Phytophthora fragariae]KAE9109642.1 hypothetical protein PF010_g11458 [Phytophthora fragariae]KAE9121443.1 hypothetical protein PF007_g7810 [Phytophthora fragariae]KAE9148530.1 hypothetical protein PF006_g6880 [Phytophthora fragariae]KAE9220154.1 hypothetical protein PF005_g7590 [Phytophthora fragariae]
MPLFSRSSSRAGGKAKSHRFSLRKHHRHLSDADSASSLSSSRSSHSDRKPHTRRQTQPATRDPEQTIVAPRPTKSKSLQGQPSTLSSSVRSSASTLRSTSPTLNENLSGGENDTEISEDSEARDSVDTPPQSRVPSKRNSRHSASAGQTSSRNSRNSLAEYRQLQCSMSYKNRVNSDTYRANSSSPSDARMSDRMSDMRSSLMDGFRTTNSSVRSSDGHSLLNARISESSTAITPAVPAVPETAPLSAAPEAPSQAARFSEASNSSANSRMTEAGVAALQTRRAFQQMVLAMEDEDSGDEYESDSDAWRTSSAESSQGSSGVVRLGADEYRKFQFRLRQLEELTAEQARKQADMEQTIEQEVQTRTQKVVEAMEKQISMYKQAKELECEREVQRRVSEHLENPRLSRSASRASVSQRSSTYALRPSSSVGSFRESYNISGSIKEEGNSLEKLLHPRRSRKRLEQLKEHEEAQKREMEQFREFIRTTEMRVTQTQGVDGVLSAAQLEKAKDSLEELADPLLPESLLQSSPSDLIELICVLRKNGYEQEKQIEEAKGLVTAAIEAREDAESTAREAVELTLLLDARLERAVRDEQKLVRQARKFSAADEFRHAREPRGFSSASDWQSGTPASSSSPLLE